MSVNANYDGSPDGTTNSSSFATVYTLTLSTIDQTYVANLRIQARRASDGISAAWNKLIVLERTGGTTRVLSPNLIDTVTPIKDTAALFWDVQAVVDGLNFYVQAKGGSASNPVAWFVDGTVRGIKD